MIGNGHVPCPTPTAKAILLQISCLDEEFELLHASPPSILGALQADARGRGLFPMWFHFKLVSAALFFTLASTPKKKKKKRRKGNLMLGKLH